MRLFIPEIGTVITLAEDWTFKVVNESRNKSLAVLMVGARSSKSYDYYHPFGTKDDPVLNDGYGRRRVPIDPGSFSLAAGTSLEVDRIYIRKGNEDYSSVTFKARVEGKLIRFFAKLEDVNRMEI